GKRATEAGLIIIEARRHRTQEQNRFDAVDRLVRLIAAAARPPKPRKKTKPTKAARQRRMNEKRQRGETKKMRAAITDHRD
ncbi:MAG TPA: peptide chain release factor-like protein, partial [Candidatus Hydrogenedentes bacterium]|nr:peptide chain release factor-like protein [Candidatus Hydrogenedentota bacterium]